MLSLVKKLPYELLSKIFLFVGNPFQPLLHDIRNFSSLYSIYNSLNENSNVMFRTFVRLKAWQRAKLIYESKGNSFISFVQEYPSFKIYEMSYLLR